MSMYILKSRNFYHFLKSIFNNNVVFVCRVGLSSGHLKEWYQRRLNILTNIEDEGHLTAKSHVNFDWAS